MCRLSPLILLEGFLPTRPRSAKKKKKKSSRRWMKVPHWMRTYCKSCCSFFSFKKSNSDRYFPYFCLSGWRRNRLPPRWKIHLIKLQSGSTITAKMRLWNWRHSIKWHLKLWAFQMGCKVDKRPVTDGPLPVGHLDIFLFLSSAHLQKSSRRTVNGKKN